MSRRRSTRRGLDSSAPRVSVAGDDELAEAARSVLDEHRADLPPEKLDVEREVIRMAIILAHFRTHNVEQWDGWALARDPVALWVEREGVAFAARVLDQPPAWDPFASCSPRDPSAPGVPARRRAF